MKIGIAHGAYRAIYGDKRYEILKEHGFDCVDFNLADTDSSYYTLPAFTGRD